MSNPNPERALKNLIEFVSRHATETNRGVLLADSLVIARYLGADALVESLQEYLRMKFGEES